MGSNAIRLRIVDIASPGRRVLDEQRFSVRLGLATYTHGALDAESIAAAFTALQACRDSCRHHAVTRYRAVATAALRDAPNRAELTDRVARELGISIEVIPGEEEARLLYLGLAPQDRAGGPIAMIELGSGSLQVAAGGEERALYLSCLPMGALRLSLEHGARGAMSPAALTRMTEAIRDGLAPTVAALLRLGVRRLLGAGGGFRAVALLDLDRASVTNRLHATHSQPHSLGRQQAETLTGILAPMDPRRREALGLPSDRADSVTAAACLSAELMRMLSLESMDLVDTNVRDGLLTDMTQDGARGSALPA